MPPRFGTDNSNLTRQHLYPRVTGPRATASFSLDNVVGSITQVDNRSYEHAFNGRAPYMTNQRVSSCVVEGGPFEEVDHSDL